MSGAKGASGLKPSQTDVEQKPPKAEAAASKDVVSANESQARKEVC